MLAFSEFTTVYITLCYSRETGVDVDGNHLHVVFLSFVSHNGTVKNNMSTKEVM